MVKQINHFIIKNQGCVKHQRNLNKLLEKTDSMGNLIEVNIKKKIVITLITTHIIANMVRTKIFIIHNIIEKLDMIDMIDGNRRNKNKVIKGAKQVILHYN